MFAEGLKGMQSWTAIGNYKVRRLTLEAQGKPHQQT